MQATKTITHEEHSSWLDRPLFSAFTLNWEILLFSLILIAAIFTRFFDLEPRVMSHDETSHVYFSWLLSQGRGYLHDPVTHGPLQFHLIAFSYFLFGDNDFTARIPVVLFSIATVGFLWYYRRYLGRAGAVIGAILFLISPYMLYYGRYVRNESYVAFFGVVTLWAILRYFETGRPRFLYFLTAATIMHFTAKETAYIYIAQVLLFLAFYFVYRITSRPWPEPGKRNPFLWSLIAAFVLLAGAALLYAAGRPPADQAAEAAAFPFQPLMIALAVMALAALAVAAYFVIKGYTWPLIRSERSFDLLMLQGTLALPLLTAFPLSILGWHVPVNASQITGITITSIVQMGAMLGLMFLLSAGLGIWWNRSIWLGNAALFYAVFIVFYTTIFSNGAGIFTGLLGGLGYWLAQQEVQRGSQPWYYYIFVQVPIYEYLAALGTFLAFGLALAGKRLGVLPMASNPSPALSDDGDHPIPEQPHIQQPPVFALFAFWTVTSISAYSYAGEKMPWLTVHIALPLLLMAALALGYLVDTVNWRAFRERRGILIIGILPVFISSLAVAVTSVLSATPPFQGRELVQLQATSTFLMAALGAIAAGWALAYLLKGWSVSQVWRIFTLAAFSLLALLTARTAFIAAYINYDMAKEYLVYAHSAPGDKIALAQIEELSRRTTGSLDIQIAYDDVTTYPFWWYLRNYPNQRYYGDSPSRDLRQAPAILVSDRNYSKIEPIVGQAYYSFEYIRIWWPNQDYFFLTWERIRNALVDPQMRTAIFQIWLNRDYSLYATLTNQNLSLSAWEPAERMRLYLRKDIAAQLWEYGAAPEEVVADPYEGGQVNLQADRIIGEAGVEPGQLTTPRDLALAPDGSLYVADTGNHRIQHFDADGNLLNTWGAFSGEGVPNPPPGQFNQPWGIAVGQDGSVYVSDTWNHRIQKFSPEGDFITTWGTFGQGETPFAFWGPRGIAVDHQGQVLVADTGNKRIVVTDPDGNFITQFGSSGFGPGQFNEPVGLAVGEDGLIYIADTWNQRVQVMAPDDSGSYFQAAEWDIVGWYGQLLDNKPFIAVDRDNNVFISDPEAHRIIQFTGQGEFIRTWGDTGATPDRFRLPTGLAVDAEGAIWVTDAGNGRLMRFQLP